LLLFVIICYYFSDLLLIVIICYYFPRIF